MARNQIIIRPASTPYMRQRRSSSGRMAEVAGGTAAECAAVWCCGPCAVMNLIILAVYKLPAGLCRRAIRRRRRRRMMKKGLIPMGAVAANGGSGRMSEWDDTMTIKREDDDVTVVMVGGSEMETDEDLMELEKEMWDRFYATGFWRSASQREQ